MSGEIKRIKEASALYQIEIEKSGIKPGIEQRISLLRSTALLVFLFSETQGREALHKSHT